VAPAFLLNLQDLGSQKSSVFYAQFYISVVIASKHGDLDPVVRRKEAGSE